MTWLIIWIPLADHTFWDAANGGPPGIIFGLIVAIFYYSFIGLGLAEVCFLLQVHPFTM